MENLTFGLTLLLVGMGGTMATLWIVTLLIGALNRWFPPGEE